MRRQTLPLVFLFLFSFIISCTNKKVSIVGKWRAVEMDIKDPEYNKMSEADKKKELENMSVEFTGDGKFIPTSRHDTAQGTYTYDEKTKSLITVTEEKTENISVE